VKEAPPETIELLKNIVRRCRAGHMRGAEYLAATAVKYRLNLGTIGTSQVEVDGWIRHALIHHVRACVAQCEAAQSNSNFPEAVSDLFELMVDRVLTLKEVGISREQIEKLRDRALVYIEEKHQVGDREFSTQAWATLWNKISIRSEAILMS